MAFNSSTELWNGLIDSIEAQTPMWVSLLGINGVSEAIQVDPIANTITTPGQLRAQREEIALQMSIQILKQFLSNIKDQYMEYSALYDAYKGIADLGSDAQVNRYRAGLKKQVTKFEALKTSLETNIAKILD